MSYPARLHEYLDAATEAARRGAAVAEAWRGKFRSREKSPANLVTEADLASQEAIKAYLLGHFAGHAFLGEEGTVGNPDGSLPTPPADAPPTWVVDPIDGTSNYVHDVPCYCVSVGLWLEGELQVGVIFDPRMNELFAAASGLGATLNGEPMRVSPVATLREAMFSTGFPAELDKSMSNLAYWRAFTSHAQALRRTGSTALNLAYVAAGRFDGYWSFDNYAWDVAAGVVLIREAGGTATLADGGAYTPFRPDILATNGLVHAEALAVLAAGPVS